MKPEEPKAFIKFLTEILKDPNAIDQFRECFLKALAITRSYSATHKNP